MNEEDLEKMATATENIKDTFLYMGFVDQELEDETGIGTYDFGETLVMLAPFGTFTGSSVNGPVEETVDETALDDIIKYYDGSELLLDVDHKSMRPVEDRDTTAAGWIYDLTAVKDLGKMNGLYGRVKWTAVGRKLVETRQYRFISPVFEITDGRPYKLINAALTNRPAMTTIAPILNSEPEQEEDIKMTKDELKDLVKQILEEMKAAENSCGEDEEDRETANNDDKSAEEKPVENNEGRPEENANDEQSEDEKPAEDKEEDKEEVIKEEVLNSASTLGTSVGGGTEWRNLTGSAFWKYLDDHNIR